MTKYDKWWENGWLSTCHKDGNWTNCSSVGESLTSASIDTAKWMIGENYKKPIKKYILVVPKSLERIGKQVIQMDLHGERRRRLKKYLREVILNKLLNASKPVFPKYKWKLKIIEQTIPFWRRKWYVIVDETTPTGVFGSRGDGCCYLK